MAVKRATERQGRKVTAQGQAEPGARREPLSRKAWERAALEAMAHGGLAAVAVEVLAARLGATKGSFYWHFANREELIAAALQRWEQENTEAVIARVEAEPRAEERLRVLFRIVLGAVRRDLVEVSLLASSRDPLVRPVLERVAERRITYTTALFEALGFPRAEARRRSLLGYCAFLGHAQLAHTMPETLADPPAGKDRYIDEVAAILAAPLPGSSPPAPAAKLRSPRARRSSQRKS